VKPATEAGRMSARANELRVSPIGQKMVQQSNSYRLSQLVQLRPFFASSKRSCQHRRRSLTCRFAAQSRLRRRLRH
jgi:hypothetical protein